MKNNFDKEISIEVHDLKQEEFKDKVSIWKKEFGPNFTEAISVLCTGIPRNEQDHYLFAKKKINIEGKNLFGELHTFDTSWALVGEQLYDMFINIDNSNLLEPDQDYWKKIQSKLLLLHQLFPGSKFMREIEMAIRNHAKKIPTNDKQVRALDYYLQNFFIVGQSLLIGNWVYWLEQKNNKQADEDWKETLFTKYNNDYIRNLLSYYLSEKIIGISDFLKTGDILLWKNIMNDRTFYFQGYDKNNYKFFKNVYEDVFPEKGQGNAMFLNPFSLKFTGNYLESFVDYVTKQAKANFVYNTEQLELLHTFANTLATHDYSYHSYPIVEILVERMIKKYQMEKVFNFKIYR